MSIDLAAALRCARIAAACSQPYVPQWMLDHLARLEWLSAGCDSETRLADAASDWIGATEAADIIGCSTAYVRRIATTLDGHRVGNRWLFNREDIKDYAYQRNTQRAG